MKLPGKIIVKSEKETELLAEKFSNIIEPGDIVILNGNLGTGKTFFIKKVLKNLNAEEVSSPTFSIVNEYKGKYKFYHFDFYRINYIEELYDIGFNDYMMDDEAIVFIEWGNLFPEVIPQIRIEITIEMDEDFNREFKIEEII